MARYADLDLLLADLLPELKSDEEKDAVERTLDAASLFVDSYCKRPIGYFSPSPNLATIRYFIGEGTSFLRIPEHVRGTVSVAFVDSSAWYESEQGWLYSMNAFDGFFEYESSGRNQYPLWVKNKRYAVSARWGYASTPDDVREAVRQITVKWFQTSRGIFGTSDVTPAGFIVERDLPLSARAILDNYVKREFER
jgi:hypothetical protein